MIDFSNKFKGDCIHTHSGGHFDGVDTLKTRLLPWLGTCFSVSRPSVTNDTSLQLIQVTITKRSYYEQKTKFLSHTHFTYGAFLVSVLMNVYNIFLFSGKILKTGLQPNMSI